MVAKEKQGIISTFLLISFSSCYFFVSYKVNINQNAHCKGFIYDYPSLEAPSVSEGEENRGKLNSTSEGRQVKGR